MNVLNRIKLKISRGKYEFSRHSLFDKLPIYDFTTDDILNVVYTCKSIIKQTGDARGARYVIVGNTLDNTEIEVICRFIENKILFITIYKYE
ncbi:MAG: DUF4258 domain-containing protein [Acidobacteria bacterium]|nr:DUF4258 domain-containing protein [Acidobacteriota bacterium]